MSVNDDIIQPSSDSFWEVGNFKYTVKRIDNGHKLCDSLKAFIDSRSEIEKSYAKQLQNWSKKWNDYLDKGPEYGTMQAGWRGVLSEADKLCALHNQIADELMNDVHSKIKSWQKDNFHKSMMHFKETKELEDGFRKAQKPWTKRLNKVLSTKKDYHAACRQEKSTANQENNARGDQAVSQDQVRKLQEKLTKCAKEVEGTRKTYEASLNDLNGYNAKYIEDMTQVFNSCQDFEHKRLEYFKEMLYGIHKCLDLSESPEYSRVYKDLHSTVGNVESQKDLKWWSNTHGAGMSMNWPVFEEYSPELQAISRKGKSGMVSTSGDGITITSIKHSREGSYASNSSDPPLGYNQMGSSSAPATPPVDSYLQRPSRQDSYDRSLNPFGDDSDEEGGQAEEPTPGMSASIGQSETYQNTENTLKENCNNHSEVQQEIPSKILCEKQEVVKEEPPENRELREDSTDSYGSANTNPFEDEENGTSDGEETSERVLVDDGRPGVPVRALYDYKAMEKDELTFNYGEVFSKLEDEDEQGWCKGRKDGRVGLYPANYVEPV